MIPIPPSVAASAASSVASIAKKALSSVIGIFDPGKKRDANREARAQMWYEIAKLGSITAARRVLGGSTIQYTDKERAMYATRWASLRSSNPQLAAAAQRIGGLGVPEPGSGAEPPQLDAATIASLQAEIEAASGVVSSSSSSSATPVLGTVATAPASRTTLLLVLAGGAVLVLMLVIARQK